MRSGSVLGTSILALLLGTRLANAQHGQKIAKVIPTGRSTMFTNKNMHTKLLGARQGRYDAQALNSDTNTTNQFRGLSTAGILRATARSEKVRAGTALCPARHLATAARTRLAT